MLNLWDLYYRAQSTHDCSPHVLIPLDEAHLHSHSYRLGRRPHHHDSNDDDDGDNGYGEMLDDVDEERRGSGAASKDDDHEETGMLEMNGPAEYSLEGLRREVRRGAKDEKWTTYESEITPLRLLMGPKSTCCAENED